MQTFLRFLARLGFSARPGTPRRRPAPRQLFTRTYITGCVVLLVVLCACSFALIGLREADEAPGPTPGEEALGAPATALPPTRFPRATPARLPTATQESVPQMPAGSGTPAMPEGLVRAQVERVIDGDTIAVLIDGRSERVRMIGIDTPESVHPSQPVECFGREASAYAAELMSGQVVYLEEDPSQDSRDRYGRMLRYVWLEDGRLVNLVMIAEGYAFEYTFETPYKYQGAFQQAEQTARAQEAGLWSPATCDGQQRPAGEVPALLATEVLVPTPPPAPGAGCDPAYPDVCIPPPPPDLNCGDISARRFTVRPPDPHGFDGDNDGVGCER